MLISIAIKNFAIVRELEVNWHAQMTTVTGETGAGKSIAIDALSQALGARSDGSVVRAGANKAEIAAEFDISKLITAQKWLEQNDLNSENECILRRVISKEGRSQAYINGTKVPASQLKSLGSLLVSIHGQHAHQQLSKPEHQCKLLDEYANNASLLHQVKTSFQEKKAIEQALAQLIQQQQESTAQQQLLQYQVDELDEAELLPDEFQAIEQEHKKLHHANNLMMDSQNALDILTENDSGNAYSAMQSAMSLLIKAAQIDEDLSPTIELLNSALIQLEEGAHELRQYSENLDLNPERLNDIEQRLNLYMDLARKHQISPEQLPEHHEALSRELAELTNSDARIEELQKEIAVKQQEFEELCQKLTAVRTKYAKELNKKITSSMNELNMAGAQFEIQLKTDISSANGAGAEKVEFYVSANPGQPLQPMAKVASGGELSRISLAIQVIIAQKVTTPTLLFDEVDVGVSGPTASAVGKLMNKLSNNTQVICVTHLPQVACYGHQQQFVHKASYGDQTETSMQALDADGRIDELARLLGGDKISATSKANAQELLSIAHAH
ncbi:MAG: DNA repair protein RecN [Gammaproteobacteria bacterium]|nr:DNA repair protein RecN [Gammaproteobacteria bacterium]